MTKADLGELLERVEGAAGADRELDAAIAVALTPGAEQHTTGALATEAGCYWRPVRGGMSVTTATDLTASIDAALALVERACPEANCWGIDRSPPPFGFDAHVSRNDVPDGHWIEEARAATAPLAILAALLKAMIAQDTSHD